MFLPITLTDKAWYFLKKCDSQEKDTTECSKPHFNFGVQCVCERLKEVVEFKRETPNVTNPVVPMNASGADDFI